MFVMETSPMSRRDASHLVLLVQHGGNALHLGIGCLNLVQPADQDTDVRIDRSGFLHDVLHTGM